MRSGDKFVKIYNELAIALQEATATPDNVPFFELLEIASKSKPTIRRKIPFLKSMGRLRNAIVHDRHYPEAVIADPRQEVLEEFEAILERIKSPTLIIPFFQKQILFFLPEDPLGKALSHMQQNDFSQVVVLVDGNYRILSSEGIVRWVSNAKQVGLADVEGATIRDIYAYEEQTGCCYMGRNETTDAAILAFENAISKGIPRLPAILITHNGKPTEKPIGIITPWDLIGISGNQ
ncbi:MAG: CBS domain-containing protein [Desulfobacteraceae bacterium]|nr:CBS domain-containing protein [Desulfobacteraceae bacterium]MBC2748825.1 CBS domain-containing protein [Desulfobacteraceae bacterium]